MSSPREYLASRHPEHFFLDPMAPMALEQHLETAGLLESNERIRHCEIAGEGNMNCTLREQTTARSLIVKQARPWVEKYPQFEAPWERVLRESEFYKRVSSAPAAAAMMPRWIGCDESHHILLLEDLGEMGDYRPVYSHEQWDAETLEALASYLTVLHRVPETGKFANRAMRELNHAHIFQIPLQSDNGLDLDAITPGLSRVAAVLKSDAAYRGAIDGLGALYLEHGSCLLHGDFYPGSWVRYNAAAADVKTVISADDVWVIDPEFCFFGPAEFDLGIFVGHLLLAGRPAALVERVFADYRGAAPLDRELALRFAGMEIMRRLIGVAQLPLVADLARKQALLNLSRKLVLRPESFGR